MGLHRKKSIVHTPKILLTCILHLCLCEAAVFTALSFQISGEIRLNSLFKIPNGYGSTFPSAGGQVSQSVFRTIAAEQLYSCVTCSFLLSPVACRCVAVVGWLSFHHSLHIMLCGLFIDTVMLSCYLWSWIRNDSGESSQFASLTLIEGAHI